MPKLTRKDQKLFAGSSANDLVAKFGTMKTGSPVYSKDLAVLQSSEYSGGWSEALLNDKAPYLEEMNGVQYGLSYQSAYMLQEGVAEYSSTQTYYKGSIVKGFNDNNRILLYESIADDNVGNELNNGTYWRQLSFEHRQIGETFMSLLPVSSSDVHLLDGSLISGSGIYADFVSYIANLVSSGKANACFVSEAQWQEQVGFYGVCGKFVYNSVNNTVRLPKVTGIIEGTIDINSIGGLIEAGVPAINIPGHNHTFGGTTSWNGDHSHGYRYPEVYGSAMPAAGVPGLQYADTQTSTAGGHNHTYSGTTSWYDGTIISNSIYGKNSKVQPQTIRGYIYIVIATKQKTELSVDIDEIASDLNLKTDLGQATKASLPSNTAINVTLSTSGSTYTAPADGLFSITTTGTAKLVNNTTGYNDDFNIFVKQGDVITITYTGTTSMKFIYAEGSEP